MNVNPSAIEILEWLAHKADFTEASIAFGAGGWKQHVAPALRVVLDEITAYQDRIAALRQRVKELERLNAGWEYEVERCRAERDAAEKRVEDYDTIRKERDYYALEFSCLTSDVPPMARKTLMDTIRSLRQRVGELERARAALREETEANRQRRRAEAAEAEVARGAEVARLREALWPEIKARLEGE